MINKEAKILILGGTGLVGSAFKRVLQKNGYTSILSPTRSELDLFDQSKTIEYVKENSPHLVINAAARVGGIKANTTFPFEFIYENIQIQMNVLKACVETKTKSLLNFSSNCAYPKNSKQPIKEEYLLTDTLEPTNEPYAIAKLAGLKLLETYRKQHDFNYLTVIPCCLYGENDNFNPEAGHVVPGIIRRMHEAIEKNQTTFDVWGTGSPRREFMYVEDLVDACMFLLSKQDLEFPWLNVGTGSDITIKSLVETISKKMQYQGELHFDTSKPDGMPLKCLDQERMSSLGWKPTTSLEDGLDKTISWFKANCL